MKISRNFYFRFWLKNSVMAFTTGFVLGLMLMGVIPFLFPMFVIPVLAFLIYQYTVYMCFWGKRKGNFEYAYREWLQRKPINSYVIKTLGLSRYIRLYMDELSTIGNVREEIYKTLQRKEKIIQNDRLRFSLHMRIAESALKESNFDKEIEFLRRALSIMPNNLVANYRLGNSLERTGDGPGAIDAYRAGLKDPVGIGKEVETIILDQIKRVETSGPIRKPPILGFRYMSW